MEQTINTAIQKIYDKLWNLLSSSYCLTIPEKTSGWTPCCKQIAGNDLYYDEGNEEIRTREGLYWKELPEDIRNEILAEFLLSDIQLQDKYLLAEPDRNDECPAGLFAECLEKKNITPLYEEDYFVDMIRFSAIQHAREALMSYGLDDDDIKALATDSAFYNAFDEIRFAIEERDHSTPCRDLLRQSTMHGFVQLGSNYDCWIDIWDAGGLYYEESALQGLLAVLGLNPRKVKQEALRQGIACHGRWPNYPGREGREAVDCENFIKSLRECPNYGNWAFFGTFDMQALMDAGFDTDTMTIPAGTYCGMFNNWNGGGTLFFCKTVRPLDIKDIRRIQNRYKDTLHVRIDENNRQHYGYTPLSVYGRHISEEPFLTT